MTDLQKGVITLIKSAVTGEKYPLPEGFSINEAYDFIIKHRVMMLAYDGAVRCGIPKSEPAMQKLFQCYVNGMLHSEKQMEAVKEIYAAFDENGIDYLPLKGCNIKFFYPKPELRSMGDADILIRTKQYDKLKDILEGLNFEEEAEISHHYVWNSDRLHLEMHTEPMPSSYKKFQNYYGDGWERAIKTETNRYIYSDEDTFVFLLAHFAKHYLEGGIGLRHITDIFVYLKSIPNMDFDYIEKELSKIGLLKFYKNIVKTISYYFKNGKSDEAVEIISEYILQSGNWGSYKSHVFASGARSNGTEEKVTGSKFRFLIKAAFPSAESIKGRYTILKKAPFLIPIIWPVRWIDAIIFRGKNVTNNFKKLDILDDEKSEVYREKFEKSGFDL